MINLYFGHDPREEVGTHVFLSSVFEHTKTPVMVSPLHRDMFTSFYAAGQRDGSNAFTYTRFLIPFLQGWTGTAIFADGADMLARCDLSELWAWRDPYKAVQVVKHDYKTKHPRKYIGTPMEAQNRDYPRKNWSSLMIINCSHFAWRDLTPEKVSSMSGPDLHRFSWLKDSQIGGLPIEWNWLADEFGENPEAKILHWTAGIPAIKHYADAPHAAEYRRQMARASFIVE